MPSVVLRIIIIILIWNNLVCINTNLISVVYTEFAPMKQFYSHCLILLLPYTLYLFILYHSIKLYCLMSLSFKSEKSVTNFYLIFAFSFYPFVWIELFSSDLSFQPEGLPLVFPIGWLCWQWITSFLIIWEYLNFTFFETVLLNEFCWI